jgi:hypothetical protein
MRTGGMPLEEVAIAVPCPISNGNMVIIVAAMKCGAQAVNGNPLRLLGVLARLLDFANQI